MPRTYTRRRDQDFATALADILAPRGRNGSKELAAQIGMDARNLYGRLVGRVQFTPEELMRVLQAVPDPRLADCLLAGTPFTVMPRPVPAAHVPGASPVSYAICAVEAAVAALRAATLLTEGNEAAVVDVREHAMEAARQLAAMELALAMQSAGDSAMARA